MDVISEGGLCTPSVPELAIQRSSLPLPGSQEGVFSPGPGGGPGGGPVAPLGWNQDWRALCSPPPHQTLFELPGKHLCMPGRAGTDISTLIDCLASVKEVDKSQTCQTPDADSLNKRRFKFESTLPAVPRDLEAISRSSPDFLVLF